MDKRLLTLAVVVAIVIALVFLMQRSGKEEDDVQPEMSEPLKRFGEACLDAGIDLEGLFYASGDDMPIPPELQGYGLKEWAEMTAENHVVQLIRVTQFQDASSAERYFEDRRSGLIDERAKDRLKQVARERGTRAHFEERPVEFDDGVRVGRWCCDVMDKDPERGERILALFVPVEASEEESAGATEGSASAPASPDPGGTASTKPSPADTHLELTDLLYTGMSFDDVGELLGDEGRRKMRVNNTASYEWRYKGVTVTCVFEDDRLVEWDSDASTGPRHTEGAQRE